MADGGTVVKEGFAGAVSIVFGNVGDADFEFERRGDAIHKFVTAAGKIGAVPMKINEAGGEDERSAVDLGAALKGLFADGGDLAGVNGDVADGVEAGFRVEDAGVSNDEVVGLGEEGEGKED